MSDFFTYSGVLPPIPGKERGDILRAAAKFYYMKYRWECLPADDEKKPIIKTTDPWHHNSIFLHDAWDRAHNIVLVVGIRSGVFVVDFDKPKEGTGDMDPFTIYNGELLQSFEAGCHLSAETPSGGRHFYFKLPVSEKVGNREEFDDTFLPYFKGGGARWLSDGTRKIAVDLKTSRFVHNEKSSDPDDMRAGVSTVTLPPSASAKGVYKWRGCGDQSNTPVDSLHDVFSMDGMGLLDEDDMLYKILISRVLTYRDSGVDFDLFNPESFHFAPMFTRDEIDERTAVQSEYIDENYGGITINGIKPVISDDIGKPSLAIYPLELLTSLLDKLPARYFISFRDYYLIGLIIYGFVMDRATDPVASWKKALELWSNYENKKIEEFNAEVKNPAHRARYNYSELVNNYEDLKTKFVFKIDVRSLKKWFEECGKLPEYTKIMEINTTRARETLVDRNFNTFDVNDPYVFTDFVKEFHKKEYLSYDQLAMALLPKATKVIAYINSGEGYYIKKESVNKDHLDQLFVEIKKTQLPTADEFHMIIKVPGKREGTTKTEKYAFKKFVQEHSTELNMFDGIDYSPDGKPGAKRFNVAIPLKARKVGEINMDLINEFNKYLLEIFCDNNPGVFADVLRWTYVLLTKYDRKTGVILYIEGEKGYGKSTYTNFLTEEILGEHLVTVAMNVDDISAKFNAHMAFKRLVVADEASFGDPRNKDDVFARMKKLITEPSMIMEAKGKDAKKVKNNANYVIISNPKPGNSKPIIQVEPGDRRYLCIRVSDEKRSLEYWNNFYGKFFKTNFGNQYYSWLLSLPEDSNLMCPAQGGVIFNPIKTELFHEIVFKSLRNFSRFIAQYRLINKVVEGKTFECNFRLLHVGYAEYMNSKKNAKEKYEIANRSGKGLGDVLSHYFPKRESNGSTYYDLGNPKVSFPVVPAKLAVFIINKEERKLKAKQSSSGVAIDNDTGFGKDEETE